MINESLLISNIIGLVGFRNSTIRDYDIVSSTNQTANSSQYYQDGFALVTIKNIHETQENPDITSDEFNDYLIRLQNTALIQLCTKIISDKSRHIGDYVHYPNRQSFNNTYDVGTGFVGMELRPSKNEDVLVKITSITASFDSAITLPIYLYTSESDVYVYTQNITTVDKRAVRQAVNWSLSINKDNSGGIYYLGYHSSDLSEAKPYRRDYDDSNIERSYFYSEYNLWTTSGTRINPESFSSLEELFGLNLEYSVYTDYTMQLIQNKYLLINGLKLQMAEIIVDQILNTTRSNIDERLMKEARNIANYNLDGSKSNIRERLDREIRHIRKTLWPEPVVTIGTLR